MTHSAFPALVQQMKEEGADFTGLAGFAGNIYNTNGWTIQDNWTHQHVSDLFDGRPVFITETGSTENSVVMGR